MKQTKTNTKKDISKTKMSIKKSQKRIIKKTKTKSMKNEKSKKEVNKMNKKVSIVLTAEVIDKMRDMSDKEISEMVFEMHNHAVRSTNCKQGAYEIDLQKFNQIERTKF
jgi:hypothetical protein